MVFWDIGYLLCFELAHKMAGFLGLLPLFRAVLSQTLQITALNILSRETLLRIMQNPLAILMALLWALVFVSYFYLEFAVLALYFERGWQGDGRSFSRLLVLAVRRLGELFLPRNWLMLLGMLLVLPLLVLPYSGNLGSRPRSRILCGNWWGSGQSGTPYMELRPCWRRFCCSSSCLASAP